MNLPRQHKGFTLIELLVVIAIIGILSSTVLAALSDSRMQARDNKRISQMNQIKNALELFRNKNGFYPCSTGNVIWPNNRVSLLDGTAASGSTAVNDRPAGCSDIRPYLTAPTNEIFSSPTDDYLYRSLPLPTQGTMYALRVRVENTNKYPGGYCVVTQPADYDVASGAASGWAASSTKCY